MKTIFALLIISIINCQSITYDYIIIGGGASGTIASVELAKKYPNSSVLLLERGISDLDIQDTHSLSGWPDILLNNTIHDSIRYVDGVWTLVAKVLSGGSGMNAGIMGEENEEFFTNAFGFNKEQNIRIKEMYQTLYDELGHKTILSELGGALIAAAEELGLNNTGFQHGYVKKNTTFQTYSAFDMEKNIRNTTADYIRNHIDKGEVPNLTVQVKTLVNRLIITENNQIGAVSVVHNGVPKIYNVRCSVLLAGGAIKSTQLLQVSGIGASDELKAAGIPTVIDMQEVGKGYIDRLLESVVQFSSLDVKLPLTPITSLSVEEGLLEERTAGGTVASVFAIITGAILPPNLRSTTNMEIFKIFLENYPRLHECMNNAIQINILIANPTSRGYIKPATPNINDSPIIDPKFMDTQEDKDSSVKAKKKCHDYYDASPLKKFARKQTGPSLECGLLIDFPVTMTSERTSSLHLFGGITYGKVLEKDFKVKSIDNLYVIDASIYPRATEINPWNTISALAGFIAREFVNPPTNTPILPTRVQIVNKEESDQCLALGSVIYAKNCELKAENTLHLIQEIATGRYVTNVKADTAYLIRSALDDRYCMNHLLDGITNSELCNSNNSSQKVFFRIKEDNYYQVKFDMEFDIGPCMLKWWGSHLISGFECELGEKDRLLWSIKVVEN